MLRAAESRGKSRSWHRGDRDASLIYWVHFLARRFSLHTHTDTLSHTHTHPAASTGSERGKQKVCSEEQPELTVN